jgi:hypothetical protein
MTLRPMIKEPFTFRIVKAVVPNLSLKDPSLMVHAMPVDRAARMGARLLDGKMAEICPGFSRRIELETVKC